MTRPKTNLFTAVGVALLLIVAGLVVSGPAIGKDRLTLRINDAEGMPGGLVAIVLRTYSSRPLGQGQVCFRAVRAGAGQADADGPFAGLEGVQIFGKGDAKGDALLETTVGGQNIVLQFSSESGRINRSDGPLAVLYMRLREDVRRGQSFEIDIDTQQTILFGAEGEVISVRPRSGTLDVRRKHGRPKIEADGDSVRPGDRVSIGVETLEPFAIDSGRVGLLYDPAIVARTPKVKMDKRHGRRKFSVDTSTPGFVGVEFESKRGAINEVPGKFIEIRLRTSRNIAAGTVSELTFDSSTAFFDAEGNEVPVKLMNKTLTFVSSSDSSAADDTDSDTDIDSDGDTDGDSDGDTDGDSDGDTDGDSDGDTDGDSDGDTDGDSDGDTDGDSDSDTDGDSDSDTDGDSDSDTDGDSDGDTDGDSDGDTDGDSDSDTDGDTDGDDSG